MAKKNTTTAESQPNTFIPNRDYLLPTTPYRVKRSTTLSQQQNDSRMQRNSVSTERRNRDRYYSALYYSKLIIKTMKDGGKVVPTHTEFKQLSETDRVAFMRDYAATSRKFVLDNGLNGYDSFNDILYGNTYLDNAKEKTE